MNIIEKFVADLREYENNPRDNDGAVDAVAESIKQFGFKVPIIVDNDNVIVAGHTRLKAAKKLGLETVPCIVANDLTPEQVNAFRLADNKTAELATWDFDKLTAEMESLVDSGISMDAFGFDLSHFETPSEIVEDEVPEIDEEAEPIVKRGEVWQLGDHYLMCGDATIKEDVERLMASGEYPTSNGKNADYRPAV